MKKLLCALLAFAAFSAVSLADDAKPRSSFIIAKPAADDATNEKIPPLTEKNAKLAAMMAVAFENLPSSFFNRDDAKVVWILTGPFRVEGIRFDRYSVLFQADNRTFAGVDIAKQEGNILVMQGFELETHEGPLQSCKVKVVEKDSASTSYFVFDYDDIERASKKAVQDLIREKQRLSQTK